MQAWRKLRSVDVVVALKSHIEARLRQWGTSVCYVNLGEQTKIHWFFKHDRKRCKRAYGVGESKRV